MVVNLAQIFIYGIIFNALIWLSSYVFGLLSVCCFEYFFVFFRTSIRKMSLQLVTSSTFLMGMKSKSDNLYNIIKLSNKLFFLYLYCRLNFFWFICHILCFIRPKAFLFNFIYIFSSYLMWKSFFQFFYFYLHKFYFYFVKVFAFHFPFYIQHFWTSFSTLSIVQCDFNKY